MKVIVVASRKGGVGKTTICGSLAVAAVKAGASKVAVMDLDEQGSLSQWWNAREDEQPMFANVPLDDLEPALEQMRNVGVDYVLIDTAPGMTADNAAALKRILAAADIVLVPTRPSPHDLRAIGKTVELVESAGKKMVFVVNGAANRARITGEAAIELSQHGTVSKVVLYQRTDYASSMIDGRTVQELDPSGKSAQEVAELWKYVVTQLRKS